LASANITNSQQFTRNVARPGNRDKRYGLLDLSISPDLSILDGQKVLLRDNQAVFS
jgi:hypothetical protein